jgi:hypothetical protein
MSIQCDICAGWYHPVKGLHAHLQSIKHIESVEERKQLQLRPPQQLVRPVIEAASELNMNVEREANTDLQQPPANFTLPTPTPTSHDTTSDVTNSSWLDDIQDSTQAPQSLAPLVEIPPVVPNLVNPPIDTATIYLSKVQQEAQLYVFRNFI